MKTYNMVVSALLCMPYQSDFFSSK